MYFVLLGSSALGVALNKTGIVDEVGADCFVSVTDCILVLIWVMGSLGQVRPALSRLGRWQWYPASIGLGCLTFIVASLAVRFVVHITGLDEIRYAEPFLQAGHGWTVVIVMVCVQPAIIEELAFRGVILTALGGILGRRDAVIVSALMFMVLHLSVLSFPHLFLIGLALGYLRVQTRSLYPCMAMHFTHNLLVILVEMKGF